MAPYFCQFYIHFIKRGAIGPFLWPLPWQIQSIPRDNSSLHASSNTGYHSQSNGSWRNAPEVFLCRERPEETDWLHCKCKLFCFSCYFLLYRRYLPNDTDQRSNILIRSMCLCMNCEFYSVDVVTFAQRCPTSRLLSLSPDVYLGTFHGSLGAPVGA